MKAATRYSKAKEKKECLTLGSDGRIVRFVARISRPSDAEPGKRTARSKSPHSRSPSLSTARGSSIGTQRQQLQPETKYALFTTRQPSNVVLATDTPISGRLISSALLSEQDIPYFSSSLQNAPHTFAFDAVYDECTSQEKFYNQNVRQLVQSLTEGRSSTMICFGPSEYLPCVATR